MLPKHAATEAGVDAVFVHPADELGNQRRLTGDTGPLDALDNTFEVEPTVDGDSGLVSGFRLRQGLWHNVPRSS